MKEFEEVLDDLDSLRGLTLHSISGAAEPFCIKEINREGGKIILDENGTTKSRPLNEIQKIWTEMAEKPAAHVETVLGGSGSKRNQPETILASLPYVEHFKIGGKKHIAYVGKNTHEPGQLKEMDAEHAAQYEKLMHEPHPRNPLLPPEVDEGYRDFTREELLDMENRDFIFSCLEMMSRHRLFNGFTLPILESREQCSLLFRHNNIHGILFKRPKGAIGDTSHAAIKDEAGRARYYTETFSIGEDEYYVSSQWRPAREDARNEFLDWLFELLLTIRFETGVAAPYSHNRIVFGAPGTGKSFRLDCDKNELLNGTTGSYERVTFHPEYTYSQFVGSYKPITNAIGEIRYEFVPGPFMRVLVDALKSGQTDNPQPHLLLIEEINRAKVAAVFGEVFQLLDRNAAGSSFYEIHASEDIKKHLISKLGKAPDGDIIKIPDNMFIWATMNSADQGVFPMDTAFKRRWNFEYIGIDENDKGVGGTITLGQGEYGMDINWNTLRKAINEVLAATFRINEDKLLGPFFLSKKVFAYGDDGRIIDPQAFTDAFKSKVIMYLYEDAAKSRKHELFQGCDSSRYSSVCSAFDIQGITIFGDSFVDIYRRMEA